MKKCYTEGQFISFIEKAFGEGRVSSKDIQVVCPRCKKFKSPEPYYKQKLAIRISAPHVVHCWVCGLSGKNIYNVLKKYKPNNLEEYRENFVDAEELLALTPGDDKTTDRAVMLPKGFTFLAEMVNGKDRKRFNLTNRYVDQALDYLWGKRNIRTEKELWYWKLGITDIPEAKCKYRIIIPSYDENGIISYWTGRSWLRKPKIPYKNPICDRKNIIFNELNIDWSIPLTIVEGPFDLMKSNQNSTSALGSEDLTLDFSLTRKIIVNKTPVVLAFDPEPLAQEKQFKFANRLLEFNVPVKILEYKEYGRDIGSMEKNEFTYLLQNAKTYTHDYELRRKINSILI